MRLLLSLLLITLWSCQSIDDSHTLKIAVAANFQYAIEEIVEFFEDQHQINCEIIIASSGKLTAQIQEGAPYDIFISADMKYPNLLFEDSIAEQLPIKYANGQLVLWTNQRNKTADLLMLSNEEIKHIAIANPSIAPYGKASKAVLEYLDIWNKIESKLVFGENIAQTNQFIATGAAEIGFTSKSTVLSENLVSMGSWIEIPSNQHPPITQGIVSLNSGKASTENKSQFLEFITSTKAEEILIKNGYTIPLISRSAERKIVPVLDSIILSNGLEGSILIFDETEMTFLSNNYEWAQKGRLPASTFKIPNSIIALESGIVQDESHMFPWDSVKRGIANWNQDLNFKQVFQYSCVPCYQKIARSVGPEKMIKQLKLLDYPGMLIDSSNIDNFWLDGDSRISMFEQIEFVRKLNRRELTLSEKTWMVMRNLLLMHETENYSFYGKTGWAIRGENNNGWLVGFVETDTSIYYYATNLSPKENFAMERFAGIRYKLTIEAFQKLNLIN